MKNLILFSIATLICLNLYSQNWGPLSTGILGHGTCLIVFNNKLIVAGSFSNAGGNLVNNIASWDGSSWSVLGTGLIGNSAFSSLCGGYVGQNGGVTSMVVFNNELYVGGTFNNAGGVTVKNIAKWNGSNWSDVLGGVGHYGVVNSLAVFNNELYVGGNFDTAGVLPVSNIAKWNGSAWSALGPGIPDGGFGNVGIGVYCLTTYNNMVYAGNNTAEISKWDGTNWQAVGGGIGTAGLVTGGAYTGTVFGTDLIVGGSFFSAGLIQGTNGIVKWNGLTWNHFGAPNGNGLGSGFADGCVGALTIYNGSLYAGGSFNGESTGNPLNSIAKFVGTVGISENFNPEVINVYPNPSSGALYL